MTINNEVTLDQLKRMKKMALARNDFREVEKINRIIALKEGRRRTSNKGRKPKFLRMFF